MATKRYRANVKLFLSHECRFVEAGEEFETEFPTGPGGKPMVLGKNIEEVPDVKPKRRGAAQEPAADAQPTDATGEGLSKGAEE